MTTYQKFQVLLDDPAIRPGLGFDDYAAALAQVIANSPPRFAIGVFGPWGCGKTTLMAAVKTELAGDPGVIPIWFNAWRYEREQHLIVPLLDVLRSTLKAWTESNAAEDVAVRDRATRLTGLLARATRALVAGMSLKAGIPGTLEATWEATKTISDWEGTVGEGFQSAYHASFSALEQASRDFLGDGERRFVVFVDDLDRCLPEAALQVLESMKLFFDMLGFVFVVGLDRAVIERAVQVKYSSLGEPGAAAAMSAYVSGTDYIKKIFQVQFGLPMLREGQLDEFVLRLAETTGIPGEQRADLIDVVRAHLTFLTGDGTVNPREVKRLINGYVMQMKTLERKLDDADPHVVLALQTMAFRRDWLPVYERLEADPATVADLIGQAIERGTYRFTVAHAGDADIEVHLPQALVGYLQGVGASLLTVDLSAYLSSIEATQSTDTRLREGQRALALARQAVRGEQIDSVALQDALLPLREVLPGYRDHPAGSRALTRLSLLIDRISDPATIPPAKDARNDLEYLDAALRELRLGTTIGLASA